MGPGFTMGLDNGVGLEGRRKLEARVGFLSISFTLSKVKRRGIGAKGKGSQKVLVVRKRGVIAEV